MFLLYLYLTVCFKVKHFISILENQCETDTLDGWQHDDKMFVQTTASEKVENLIKSKNLVIVAGHSGCGKTAIVQHIALKYRKSV